MVINAHFLSLGANGMTFQKLIMKMEILISKREGNGRPEHELTLNARSGCCVFLHPPHVIVDGPDFPRLCADSTVTLTTSVPT